MDNKEVRLISINKEEAVVAEMITTYKRKDLEEQLVKLTESLNKEVKTINDAAADINNLQARIAEIQQIIKKEKAEMEANSYKKELYEALLEAFNTKYPVAEAEKTLATSEEDIIKEEPEEPEEITVRGEV